MEHDPELRIATDPSTGRPILVAPHRRSRPLHTRDATLGPCPFCPGEEYQTPPETDRAGGEAWTVRSFPNLFPATPDHEVIVEGATHETQPGRVPVPVWHDAIELYRRRITALESRPNVQCGFLFKNVGREAGASIAHNHSQLIGLPMLPPRLELELEQSRVECPHCADLATAERDDRLIYENQHFVLLCPATPKLPHETWLLPKNHDSDFLQATESETQQFAEALQATFSAVEGAFDAAAFNAYVHRVPSESFHWHMEFQPRTSYLAGLELGGDMYINSITGAESAARIRESI